MNKPDYKAKDIKNLLRNRFSDPAFAFLPQVRNGTGYIRSARTADALAMGLWPSRGLDLHGFEIKIYRNDWLHELKSPQKAEEIAKYCDFWWIVAPKDVVKTEEIPQNWGLMIPFGATVKIIKEAKHLKPTKIDRLFLAAILRKAQEVITPEAKIKEAVEEGKKLGKEAVRLEFEYAQRDHKALKEAVEEFEKISGVHINQWQAGNVGEAVKMVLNSEHLQIKKSLLQLLETSKEISGSIEKHLNEIK